MLYQMRIKKIFTHVYKDCYIWKQKIKERKKYIYINGHVLWKSQKIYANDHGFWMCQEIHTHPSKTFTKETNNIYIYIWLCKKKKKNDR